MSYTYDTVTGLPGSYETEVTGLNDSGVILAYSDDFQFFLDNNGVIEKISYPGSGFTYATHLNNNGRVVGYANSNGGFVGFIEDGAQYNKIVYNDNEIFPTAVNDHGKVVGDYSDASGAVHGFIELYGKIYSFNDPLAKAGTVPEGVNNAGEIYGKYLLDNQGDGFAFVESHNSFKTIIDPNTLKGSMSTAISGLNDLGEITGTYENINHLTMGFIEYHGVYTDISDPYGAQGTIPTAINNKGQVAGDYIDATGVWHGFVDTNGQFVTIDDPLGGGGTYITAMNNNGEVGGYFDTLHGVLEGFTAQSSTASNAGHAADYHLA